MKLFHFDVSERSSVDNKVRAFAKATALDLGLITKEEIKTKQKVNGTHWVPLGSFKNKKDAYDYIQILRDEQKNARFQSNA
jgi:hypothetical protein|tara:strand:- start:391 stop:633 length:243 start_codon:yes stop_codon:yes gene_type:complete